jgi:hypothetical protein
MKFAASLLIAMAFAGSGCSSGSGLTIESRGDLIAAAVARRTLVDSSLPGVRFDTVAIVDQVGSSDADGFIAFSDDDPPLTDVEREAIERVLAPAEVRFVSAETDRLIESEPGHAAVVTVARPKGDDREATIATGLVCGGTCGAGGTQRFERGDEGGWIFIENVGGQWIS